MATLATRDLKIGKIIDKTLGVLELNALPALVFVVVLTAVSVPITYFSVGSLDPLRIAGGQLLQSVIGMICGYFLLVAIMRRTGLEARGGEDVFLPYLGMSLLSGLAVMLGLIVFILPGLFLIIRWIVAGPLMVARGGKVMATLGESWDRTRGHEFAIIVAVLAVIVVPVVVMIAAGSLFEQGALVGMVVSQIASSALSLMVLSLGVAVYGLMMAREAAMAAPA